MTRKAPPPCLQRLKPCMPPCAISSAAYSAKKPCSANGSRRSTMYCASPKATMNSSNKTANGAWNLSPAKAVWTGSWQPLRVRPRRSSRKAQARAFESVPTHPAGSFSMIPHGRDGGVGAPCPAAAIDTKSRLFHAGTPFPGEPTEVAQAAIRGRLLHVFGRFALRPRIIAISENQPIGKRRVRVKPESNEFRRVRVCQVDLAQHLKGLSRNFG